jgi:hypothetical protein
VVQAGLFFACHEVRPCHARATAGDHEGCWRKG